MFIRVHAWFDTRPGVDAARAVNERLANSVDSGRTVVVVLEEIFQLLGHFDAGVDLAC